MAPLRTGACVEKLVISEYFTDCSSFLHSCTHVLLPLFENWGIFVLNIILRDQCLGSWRCGPVIPLHSFTSSAKTNRILTRSVIPLKTVVQNSWASLQCYWTALDLVSITVCRALGALFSQPFYVLKTGGLQFLPTYFWHESKAQHNSPLLPTSPCPPRCLCHTCHPQLVPVLWTQPGCLGDSCVQWKLPCLPKAHMVSMLTSLLLIAIFCWKKVSL